MGTVSYIDNLKIWVRYYLKAVGLLFSFFAAILAMGLINPNIVRQKSFSFGSFSVRPDNLDRIRLNVKEEEELIDSVQLGAVKLSCYR